MAASSISSLGFTDLYVCLDSNDACYQSFEAKEVIQRLYEFPHAHLFDVSAEFKEDVAALIQTYKSVAGDDADCKMRHCELQLKATKIEDINAHPWVVFQPIAKQPRPLETLGFTPAVTNVLRQLGQREGLVLVCGGLCQGKTTTSAALLYDYLHRYGGVACTLEDTIEYAFSGRQGTSGLCYQFEIQNKQDWEALLGRCLQFHARYLLVGELRGAEITSQILRVATSGQLVIANIQAGSLEEGIEGLLYFAERSIGGHAPILLASALAAVAH